MSSGYRSADRFGHEQEDRTAVVLVNLGTPDAPTAGAVRRYLDEFLSDPRVIEQPRWLWWLILHGVILRLRPARSAHAYEKVWTERGSPLLSGTADLSAALAGVLGAGGGVADNPHLSVRFAMRYGNPSISSVLRELADRGLRRLLIVPLYPQYSATTTGSVFDAVAAELAGWRYVPQLRFVNDYFADSAYIEALAVSVQAHWARNGRGEKLLLSFHGIPERYFRSGDPYFCHCQGTARRLTARLGLDASQFQVSFQSRVGREAWLQPYTDKVLSEWATKGIRQVDVVCPGFAVDCLETLEEIALQNDELFRAGGGQALRYIPALNADPAHVQMLAQLVRRHGSGWPGLDPQVEPADFTLRASERHRLEAAAGANR